MQTIRIARSSRATALAGTLLGLFCAGSGGSASHAIAAPQDSWWPVDLPPRVATPLDETAADRDARMAWWREARFGMFIHWGLYAIPSGTWNGKRTGGAEWILNAARIHPDEYM
ncbi:MAG: alpha-L-fucosidase, partial [Planctomycetota bacterium]